MVNRRLDVHANVVDLQDAALLREGDFALKVDKARQRKVNNVNRAQAWRHLEVGGHGVFVLQR